VKRHGEPQSAAGTDDGLSRLIEAEARLGRALADAEAEGVRLIDSARQAAVEEESRLQARIDAEVARLAQEIAAERDAEIARVTAEAERRSRRLESVPAAVIDQLAAEVEARLLSSEEQGAAS
jgi:hypothetical protein